MNIETFKIVKSEEVNEKARLSVLHNSQTDEWKLTLDVYNISTIHYDNVLSDEVECISKRLRKFV